MGDFLGFRFFWFWAGRKSLPIEDDLGRGQATVTRWRQRKTEDGPNLMGTRNDESTILIYGESLTLSANPAACDAFENENNLPL